MINILIISTSIFFSSEYQNSAKYFKKANKLMKSCGDRYEIAKLSMTAATIIDNKAKNKQFVTEEEIVEMNNNIVNMEIYKKNCIKR